MKNINVGLNWTWRVAERFHLIDAYLTNIEMLSSSRRLNSFLVMGVFCYWRAPLLASFSSVGHIFIKRVA